MNETLNHEYKKPRHEKNLSSQIRTADAHIRQAWAQSDRRIYLFIIQIDSRKSFFL